LKENEEKKNIGKNESHYKNRMNISKHKLKERRSDKKQIFCC
jgi:hypothetical protein